MRHFRPLVFSVSLIGLLTGCQTTRIPLTEAKRESLAPFSLIASPLSEVKIASSSISDASMMLFLQSGAVGGAVGGLIAQAARYESIKEARAGLGPLPANLEAFNPEESFREAVEREESWLRLAAFRPDLKTSELARLGATQQGPTLTLQTELEFSADLEMLFFNARYSGYWNGSDGTVNSGKADYQGTLTVINYPIFGGIDENTNGAGWQKQLASPESWFTDNAELVLEMLRQDLVAAEAKLGSDLPLPETKFLSLKSYFEGSVGDYFLLRSTSGLLAVPHPPAIVESLQTLALIDTPMPKSMALTVEWLRQVLELKGYDVTVVAPEAEIPPVDAIVRVSGLEGFSPPFSNFLGIGRVRIEEPGTGRLIGFGQEGFLTKQMNPGTLFDLAWRYATGEELRALEAGTEPEALIRIEIEDDNPHTRMRPGRN